MIFSRHCNIYMYKHLDKNGQDMATARSMGSRGTRVKPKPLSGRWLWAVGSELLFLPPLHPPQLPSFLRTAQFWRYLLELTDSQCEGTLSWDMVLGGRHLIGRPISRC